MPQPKSIPEMKAEIAQLRQAMNLPGVPADERAIYEATIARIEAAIAAQRGPATPTPAPPPPAPVKHAAPPQSPPRSIPASEGMEEAADRDLQRAEAYFAPPPLNEWEIDRIVAQQAADTDARTTKIRTVLAGNQRPVNSAGLPATIGIEADHDTDPYNPRIRITWPDGYAITVDETAARGRFATTLRDTCALRLAADGRYEAIWRWSSPWRAAGFYQALTQLRGSAPTLRELNILRPTETMVAVFNEILKKATV